MTRCAYNPRNTVEGLGLVLQAFVLWPCLLVPVGASRHPPLQVWSSVASFGPLALSPGPCERLQAPTPASPGRGAAFSLLLVHRPSAARWPLPALCPCPTLRPFSLTKRGLAATSVSQSHSWQESSDGFQAEVLKDPRMLIKGYKLKRGSSKKQHLTQNKPNSLGNGLPSSGFGYRQGRTVLQQLREAPGNLVRPVSK